MSKRLPLAKTHQLAMVSLANKSFINSNKYKEQQLRAARTGAHPDLIEFERKFVKAAKAYSIPIFASEMWRSPERQQQLFHEGFSKALPNQSPHQFGLAVDIIHSTKGWDLTHKEWAMLFTIGKEVARKMNIEIENGFNWKFYDPAHWQIKDWKTLKTDDGVILY